MNHIYSSILYQKKENPGICEKKRTHNFTIVYRISIKKAVTLKKFGKRKDNNIQTMPLNINSIISGDITNDAIIPPGMILPNNFNDTGVVKNCALIEVERFDDIFLGKRYEKMVSIKPLAIKIPASAP